MDKKAFNFLVFLVLFLAIFFSTLLGYSIKYFQEGGQRFLYLKKIVYFIADIPKPFIAMVKSKSLNPNNLPSLTKHKNKKNFQRFLPSEKNALLILPRYDHSINRSVVEVIDLQTFKIIHTYMHNIKNMNDKIKNTLNYPSHRIDNSPIRFRYLHPLILDDGSLISFSKHYPIFKIDICSKLKWINDEEQFHHGSNLDSDGNIWTIAAMFPQSKFVNKYKIEKYADDAIINIDTNGNILFKKSVTEILIENKIVPDNFAFNRSIAKDFDPIHLNDVQPATSNTDYWKKGDLFLSIRDQNAIIHYRPSNNQVVNYITGPFAEQHDVDIISDKEISIFNNNNFNTNNNYSEVLIYDLSTKKFKKLFNAQLKENNFKTSTNGLSEILNDGSLMVEETIHGRLILFNKFGQKEWEYVNKNNKNEIGRLFWSRIIEDEDFIKKYKSKVKNKECLN